jgi:hypothetical protein
VHDYSILMGEALLTAIRFLVISHTPIWIAKYPNRNYSAILANLQITSYALGVYIALLFTCQLHESLIKLYFKQFSKLKF